MELHRIMGKKKLFSLFFKHDKKKKEDANFTKKLKDVEIHHCKNFVPNIFCAKVVKVYDGDTITIATFLYGEEVPYKFSVRLIHVDAPEIRTKNISEKKAALFVTERLKEKILGKLVYITNVTYEKFGRLLANVYLDNEDAKKDRQDNSINKWLLDNNYCVVYDGGRRKPPNDWLAYVHSGETTDYETKDYIEKKTRVHRNNSKKILSSPQTQYNSLSENQTDILPSIITDHTDKNS